jgi:hypothetical protein
MKYLRTRRQIAVTMTEKNVCHKLVRRSNFVRLVGAQIFSPKHDVRIRA